MSRYFRVLALAGFGCSLGACASDVAINSFRSGTHIAGLVRTDAGTNGYYVDDKKAVLSSTVKIDGSLFFPSRVVAVFDLYKSVVLVIEGSSPTCGYRNQVVSFVRNSIDVYSTYIGICGERYVFTKEAGRVIARSAGFETSREFAYDGDYIPPVPVEPLVTEIPPTSKLPPSSATSSEKEERTVSASSTASVESTAIRDFSKFVADDYHATTILSTAHPKGHLIASHVDAVSSSESGGIVDQTFIWTYANTTFSTKFKYLVALRGGTMTDIDILINESPTPSFPAFYAVTIGKEAAIGALVSKLKRDDKHISALLLRLADKSITTPHAIGLALMLIAS